MRQGGRAREAQHLVARNARNGCLVAGHVHVATSRLARAIGLLDRGRLEEGEALWIAPSRGVHTCGMRFPIDLVALDADGVVIDRLAGLRPWRIRLPRRGVAGVLELDAGSLDRSDTQLGDRVVFEVAHASGRDRVEGVA